MQMHYLSYASALCDELSSSSDVQLMPVLKEQIFSILPEMALEPEDPSASGVERWVAHTERLHRSASLSSLRSHFREVILGSGHLRCVCLCCCPVIMHCRFEFRNCFMFMLSVMVIYGGLWVGFCPVR